MALKEWHVKALEKGRRPLPDARGEKPWLEKPPRLEKPRKGAIAGPRMPPTKMATKANLSWSQPELHLMMELKRKDKTWKQIAEEIPWRSPLALQQAWYKFRENPQTRFKAKRQQARELADEAAKGLQKKY